MTRHRRDLETSEWFHVSNRGADRQDIFSLRGDHELFESLIEDSVLHFGASIHAYAWMTNHFHLIIRAPDRVLSAVMHRVGKRYGAAYNQRTNRTGPVFDHRFHSVPITSEAQFLQAARYVHRNPLAFISPPALAQYSGSSLGSFLGIRTAPSWLDTSQLLSLIDPSTYLDRLLVERHDDRIPMFGEPTLRSTTDEVEAAVAVITGSDPRISRSPHRVLTIALALELRTDTAVDLAARYEISPNAVRTAARRGRIRFETEPALSRQRHDVLRQLSAQSRLYPVPMGLGATA